MSPVDLVLERLEHVKQRRDGGWSAKCPAHDGKGDNSLSIKEGRRQPVVLRCFAGCTYEAILHAIGLNSDAFKVPRITLGDLACDKRLPIRFLTSLGLHDLPHRGVGIPYYDETGTQQHIKRRTALTARQGSYWPAKTPLMPYGLEDLAQAREAGYLILPEGESDRWTLKYHGFWSLGIPGADAVGCLKPEHVGDIPTLYLVREPDAGGETFIPAAARRLQEIPWHRHRMKVSGWTTASTGRHLHHQDSHIRATRVVA